MQVNSTNNVHLVLLTFLYRCSFIIRVYVHTTHWYLQQSEQYILCIPVLHSPFPSEQNFFFVLDGENISSDGSREFTSLSVVALEQDMKGNFPSLAF